MSPRGGPVAGRRLGPLGPIAAATAWVGFVAMAVVVHEPDRGVGWFGGDLEFVAFSAAMAVAGTIPFGVATVVYGSLARGLASVVLAILLMPLPGAEVVRRARAIRWTPTVREIVEAARAGAGLGLAPGLAMAALLVPFALITRRRLSWRIGIAVAVAAAAVMTWVVPPVVFAWWQVLSARIDRGLLDRRWAFGGIVGGSLGAIAGAVLGGMMARWRPGLGASRDVTAGGSPAYDGSMGRAPAPDL